MSKKYFFGDFLLCTHNGLYRNGEVTHLASKELKVLEVLVESAGDVVSKEDIIFKAWSGGAVSDESLCRCIYVLRRTLKMQNVKSVIETIYGRGYRFIPEVRYEERENSRLSCCSYNEKIEFMKFSINSTDYLKEINYTANFLN